MSAYIKCQDVLYTMSEYIKWRPWSWSPQLVFQDVATPLTNMHYLGSQRGAMYSAEHNLDRFGAEAVARNRCNTPVKNLYISGRGPPPAPPTPLWGPRPYE